MNKIDPKYKKAAEFPTKTQLYLAHKAIIKYMTSFPMQSVKDEVLKRWPECYYLYGNQDIDAVLFKGMNFLAKDKDKYYTLLQKAAKQKQVTSKTVRSWTMDPAIAYMFGYYYVGSRDVFFSHKEIIASIVLTAAVRSGEGLNLLDHEKLKHKFAENEHEILMPPATMGCLVESAAFLSPSNIVYSYSSKLYEDEHNKLKKSLEKYCENMNRTRNRYPEYSSSEYQVRYLTNIDEYLYLYKKNMLS